jgi:hypothetical protein
VVVAVLVDLEQLLDLPLQVAHLTQSQSVLVALGVLVTLLEG